MTKIKLSEKTLSSELVYNGKIMEVFRDEIELPNGHKSVREVVKKPNAIGVIALTDENKIIMVKQYRYAVGEALWEIPAGKIDDGEDPDECAKRELEEETGYVAESWESLGFIYVSAGFTNEKIYLYLATDLTFKKQNLDEGEFLECKEFSTDNIFEMIDEGKINDAKTLCALMRAF